MTRPHPISPFASLLSLSGAPRKRAAKGASPKAHDGNARHSGEKPSLLEKRMEKARAAGAPFAHLRPTKPGRDQPAAAAPRAPTLAEKIERAKARTSGDQPRGSFARKMAAAVAKVRPPRPKSDDVADQSPPASDAGTLADRMARAVAKARGE